MWRSEIDESSFSDAAKLAWEKVFPHKYLLLLKEDEASVKKMIVFLEKAFSKQALRAAVKRLKL